MLHIFEMSENIIGKQVENGVSTELKEIMARWALFAKDHYSDWGEGLRAGHFFGGCFNYELETSASTIVMAVMAATGNTPGMEGVETEDAAEMAIRAIRYLCLTHHTGPEEYKRGHSRNPMISKTKWGKREGNFFMSSQNGISVSMLGLSAWLLRDRLDDETIEMTGRVLSDYADEYSGMTPGTGTYNDTQCEENAWTALGIGAALYLFPNHPNRGKWLEGYINWSLNSAVTFKDKLEMEKDKVTGKSRGGLVHDGKTYGISSVTFHPDLTTENHGYVHPDYMNGAIILRSSSAVFPLLAGEKPIESLFFNSKNIYEKSVKPWCAFDGIPISPQGQDWFYHKHHNKLLMHAAMNLFFDDREAAYFEKTCIDIIKKRQAGTGRGNLMEKNGHTLDITPGLQSVLDKEHGAIRTVVLSYLLHLIMGAGAEPAKREEVMERLSGNHFHPYGGVYIYRTEKSFASFSTRCSVMGLTIPENGLWDITADFHGYTGVIRSRKHDDGYFKDKKVNWKDIALETKKENVVEYEKGFTVTAELERAGGDISQAVSFAALPGGETVYTERIKALRKTEITTYGTGRIGVGNENYEYLPALAKGYRDIYINGQCKRFEGGYTGDDMIHAAKRATRVNIDNKIGYLLYNSSGVEYRNIHKYPKWKGLEDILILNKRPGFEMEEGDQTPLFTVVTIPGSDSNQTDLAYSSTGVCQKGGDCISVRTAGRRVSANFGSARSTIIEKPERIKGRLPIYRGKTTIKEGFASCGYDMEGFKTIVEEPAAIMETDCERLELEVFCLDGRTLFIKNNSAGKIELRLETGGRPIEVSLKGMTLGGPFGDEGI